MADPRNHRMPPVGVALTTDVELRTEGFRARVRWTDPSTKMRVGRVSHVRTMEEVEEFFDQMRKATETGTDSTVILTEYAASIGAGSGAWTRPPPRRTTTSGCVCGCCPRSGTSRSSSSPPG